MGDRYHLFDVLAKQQVRLPKCKKNRLNATHSNGFLVGLAGLEPATFRPPDGRATRLRHSPLMTGSTVFPGRGKGVFPVFFSGADYFSPQPGLRAVQPRNQRHPP